MGPVKFTKGYGVIEDPAGDQLPLTPRRSARKRRLAAAVSLLPFLTLIVGAVFVVLIRRSSSEDGISHPSTSSPVSSNPAGFLSTVCAVTQHPDSCFDSMSPFAEATPKPDPEYFLNVSLRVSVTDLVNLTSLPNSLISKVNDHGAQSALQDCDGLFADALSQLNESAALMNAGPDGRVVLTPAKIRSMHTWTSAAMTDVDTCLNGLDEMKSTVLSEVNARVQRTNEYMSNTLAILNNVQSLHEKFDGPMH